MTPAPHYRPLNETVRFVGDPVALVVADTEDIALDAMELIEVEYEELPPVFTIDEALAPDAPSSYDVFPGNIAPLSFRDWMTWILRWVIRKQDLPGRISLWKWTGRLKAARTPCRRKPCVYCTVE